MLPGNPMGRELVWREAAVRIGRPQGDHGVVAGGAERRGVRGEGCRGRRDGCRLRDGAGRGRIGGGDGADDGVPPPALGVQHFRVLGYLDTLQARSAEVSVELLAAALRLDCAAVAGILGELARAGLTVLRLR